MASRSSWSSLKCTSPSVFSSSSSSIASNEHLSDSPKTRGETERLRHLTPDRVVRMTPDPSDSVHSTTVWVGRPLPRLALCGTDRREAPRLALSSLVVSCCVLTPLTFVFGGCQGEG